MSSSAPSTDADLMRRLEAQRARQSPTAGDSLSQKASSTSGRSKTNTAQRWMRWIHTYMSMIAFLVILFFGVTGLLLNHPTWLGGNDVVTTEVAGTLPESVVSEQGGVEFLAVSEYLRSEHGIGGEVTNFDQVGSSGSINYTGPSYGASVRFDVDSLAYDVSIRSEGFVNAMRDLHAGSDTGGAWDLVIDISAVFLVLVAISGLGIQLLMRKRRQRALAWLAAGSVLSIALIWFTLV